MWTKHQGSALSAVFAALNQSILSWMVLRNYEGLPWQNRSKDVDIVLAKRDFHAAQSLIAQVMRDHGFSLQQYTRFQYAWCFNYINAKSVPSYAIKVDLLDGFVWRGAQVVDFKDLYARRVHYADFFVPDPVYDGFMLWIKPLMTGGFIKDKYRDDILRTLAAHPQEYRSFLASKFGQRLAREVWSLLERGDLDGTVKYQKHLCRAAWFIALARRPIDTIASTVEHVYREVYRRSHRPEGTLIAVIGPDGVGKSTLIDLLQKELCRVLIKEPDDVHVLHHRPNIFPNIKKLIHGKSYDDDAEEFTSPHRAKPAGRLSSLIRITYYWLDYLLGYWFRIRSRCIGGKVYIYDRYYYDFIVDPYRSRINLPEWVRLLYLSMTPQPDLVFFLDGSASTIYERKQELSLREIERQLDGYRSLANRSRRFVTLDAGAKPEELCRNAVQKLIERSFRKL